MENYTIRFVYDYRNKTGHKGKVKGKEYQKEGLLQIEVRQDKTDKRAYVTTHVKVAPNQISLNNPFKILNYYGLKIHRFVE